MQLIIIFIRTNVKNYRHLQNFIKKPNSLLHELGLIKLLILLMIHSTLNASTGFFLAAILDGIYPPINVNTVEMITSSTKCNMFTFATFASDSSYVTASALIGKVKR